jgi:hypothetical protein
VQLLPAEYWLNHATTRGSRGVRWGSAGVRSEPQRDPMPPLWQYFAQKHKKQQAAMGPADHGTTVDDQLASSTRPSSCRRTLHSQRR